MTNELEYNPDLRRKDRLKGNFSNENESIDLDGGENEELKITDNKVKPEIGEGLLTENIEEYLKLKEKIDSLFEKAYIDVIDIKTPIPDIYIKELERIKDKNNLYDKGFKIDDYLWGLENINTPDGALIVELWENYHEDVNGNLKAELIGDIFEIKKELEHTENFIQKFLINKLPNIVDIKDKDFLNMFLQEEKKIKLKNNQMEKAEERVKESYIDALLNNQKAINERKELMYNQSIFLDKNKQFNYGLIENNSILETKLTQLNGLTELISNNIDKNSYVKEEEIQRMLSLKNESNEKAIPYLQQMHLLVKLNVDNENMEKHNLKNTIRNVYSINNKDKIMNELLIEDELFNKVCLDVSYYIEYYNDSLEESSDIFLNQATKSLISIISGKKDKTKDFFTMEEGESYFRNIKLKNVLEKNDARDTYKKITELIK